MTTTNGGRIVEHVDGIVQGANERGVHLQGEPDWRNFSKYADPIAPPARGQSVRLGLDASGFVRELELLGATAATLNRDRAIARMSALRSAAIYCGNRATVHEDAKSEHIFVLAERMLAWLEKGDDA
jgi:hypothetical protein